MVSLVMGLIVVVILGLYSDFSKIGESIAGFDFRYIPLILVLAPMNYFLRYIKWSYYLRLLNIDISTRSNVKIFTAGLSMTVTPGKVGEFLKSYLLKEFKGIPVSTTSPLVVTERLTDGISMIILASIGALRFRYGAGVMAVSILLVILFIASIRIRPLAAVITGLLKRLPFLKRISVQIDAFYKSSYQLLGIKALFISVTLGTTSWAFEGIVIFLTMNAFGNPISILSSIFVVAFASIAGALSMLPGGLFVAEGSIMGLLIMMEVPREIASAATIVTRFSTLWLGVLIGIFGLIAIQRTKAIS